MGFKAGNPDLKIDLGLEKELELGREDLLIPSSILGELVIGEDVSALLLGTHMLDANAGHRREAEKTCRLSPPVTGKDCALGIDENRVGEAELTDAVCDLPDLLLRVGSRVARI